MPKLSLSTITSGYGTVDALNQNFDAIEAAFDNTLSRNGDTPNQMQANLDMNGFSILNQANPYVVDGLNWRGNWATATTYALGDIVQTNGIAYICIVAHTSGVFATDLAAVRWQVFVQTNLPTQTGNSGRYLSTDGSLTSWQPITVPDGSVTTAKLADGVLSADVAGRAKMADEFVTTTKMADGSVTTAKLADGAANGNKLGSKIQPISSTNNAGALTISAGFLSLDYRSTTLGSGTVTTVTGTPGNLVIPSGATLGTISGVQSDLVVLAINNAGTIELAVVNLAGGVQLDETNVISTNAINAGSNNPNIVYSTASRTNIAYRVIGLLRSTQATAGTWATAPSLIQGMGGNALVAMQSLGYGQTWQSVTRVAGTTYYNTTGKPIKAAFSIATTSGVNQGNIQIAGNTIYSWNNSGTVLTTFVELTIPPGASYIYNNTNNSPFSGWVELR